MNKIIFGEENGAEICSILYVLSDTAGQMGGLGLRTGDLLFLVPGVEPECLVQRIEPESLASGVEPDAPGAFISVSLRSLPPIPEDGNVLENFFSAPSGYLLFRTGKALFIREDFQRILKEGQEHRPFHQEIIRSTLAQDFCLILRKYAAETAA